MIKFRPGIENSAADAMSRIVKVLSDEYGVGGLNKVHSAPGVLPGTEYQHTQQHMVMKGLTATMLYWPVHKWEITMRGLMQIK